MGKRLARFFKRDSNVVGALGQRVAPWLGCPHVLEGGSERIRSELAPMLSPKGSLLTAPLRRDVAEDLAMCGLSVLQTTWKPRPDGARWEPTVEVFDLESVDTDGCGQIFAMTRDGQTPIVHGDGKWTVVRSTELHPHESGAVIPLALPVASRGHNTIDRNAAAQAIGHPKLQAELPEKVAVSSPEGKGLETEVAKLWNGVKHIVTMAGTKFNKIEFSGQGWQVFQAGPKMDKSDIFLALTGQDGSAANEGGNYVKAYMLQGVLFAWVVGDTMAGSSGYSTGVLRPYAIINHGAEKEAPVMEWPLPDPEEAERLGALAKRHEEYASTVKAYDDGGFEVTSEWASQYATTMRINVPTWRDKRS